MATPNPVSIASEGLERHGSSEPGPQPAMVQKEPNGTISSDATSRTPLPIEEDIMQLARLGEVGAIQKLFDAGKYDANYKDEQGITPLHWAAIKNHFALCHFLIQNGANVNAAGGDLNGTPVLWAARSCNYYVVNLLLQHGADPLRSDSQGYNLLQNATLDGNVFQLLLLLQHDIPVDTPDASGHTALMWAAYKGYPACVELLLQWGASVSATDDEGFTALHWALVKGAYGCIQKLVEYGSDRFVSTSTGKTPTLVAKEMNSMTQWRRALWDCGYLSDGNPNAFPLASIIKDRHLFLSRFFFLWPTIIIFCAVYVVSGMPIFAGVPIAIVAVFVMQYLANQLLQWAPITMKKLDHTPFLAGVFAGTYFLDIIQWVLKVLPLTFSAAPILNITLAILAVSCVYFFFLSMLEDPGWIPKSTSRSEQKAVTQELIDAGRFDEQNFCVTCMIRKPLRSKHCRRCGRCVAKQDHHCPWVNNCIAINNHRHFIFYLVSMEAGVMVLVRLALVYLDMLPPPQLTTCNVLNDELCKIYNKDPFTIVLLLWTIVHLSWITMLIFVQLAQISRAQTTLEQLSPHRHFSGPEEVVTSAFIAGTTSLADAGLDTPRPAANAQEADTARRKQGFMEQWKRLLGIDAFVATAKFGTGAHARARQRRNPFTRGCIKNWSDFFCDPAPVLGRRQNGQAMLGGQTVNYTKMYELPSRADPAVGESGEGMLYAAGNSSDNV